MARIEAQLAVIRKLSDDLGYTDLVDELRPNLEFLERLDEENFNVRLEHRSEQGVQGLDRRGF